jgi:hypothetical protein
MGIGRLMRVSVAADVWWPGVDFRRQDGTARQQQQSTVGVVSQQGAGSTCARACDVARTEYAAEATQPQPSSIAPLLARVSAPAWWRPERDVQPTAGRWCA